MHVCCSETGKKCEKADPVNGNNFTILIFFQLCAYAFPRCIIEQHESIDGYSIPKTKRLPLCQEDCIATHLQFCYNDWVLIEEKNERKTHLKSRGHFRLPNCTMLPKYNKSPKSPSCSYIGLTEMDDSLISYDCRIGSGKHYLGTQNVTATGIPCQNWNVQSPHAHITPPDIFPELKNAENYCRNLGGAEPQPWCYTMDKSVRWALCEVCFYFHSVLTNKF